MDQFEKVEKLTQRANVSYEEAKAALEATDWDLLDAMIYLEKQGKTAGPARTEYSTGYEASSNNYALVKTESKTEDNAEKKAAKKEKTETFGEKMRSLFKKMDENHFVMERYGNHVFEMPVWLMVIILLCTWEFIWILLIVSLFLGCRYSFVGPADLEGINNAVSSVEGVADSIRESVRNANEEHRK